LAGSSFSLAREKRKKVVDKNMMAICIPEVGPELNLTRFSGLLLGQTNIYLAICLLF
jgi:hypothetical protein